MNTANDLYWLSFLAEIVERGIRNHPELGIGAQAETEGGARSVGNPPSLALSGLAQSLNLKAAIEYQEGNRMIIGVVYLSFGYFCYFFSGRSARSSDRFTAEIGARVGPGHTT